MSALDDLRSRSVAESTDRPVWLAARAQGVTATEVAKLAQGGSARVSNAAVNKRVTRELIAAKLAGGFGPDLSYVPHVRWGQIREEYIAEWVDRRFNIHPNQTLFRSHDNPRHLATPDGAGINFDEELMLSEIKTSKYDLDPNPETVSHYLDTGYRDQMQWQMRLDPAIRRTLFVWETHDDDWSGWPDRGPRIPDEPRWCWVERDDERIAYLVKVADKFLAALDKARATVGDAPLPVDVELDVLAQEVLAARSLESTAKGQKETAWKELTTRLAARGTDYHQVAGARVTWSAPTVTQVEEVDVEAAEAADVNGLQKQFEAARDAWQGHRAGYVKSVPVTVPGKLTVTLAKGASDV